MPLRSKRGERNSQLEAGHGSGHVNTLKRLHARHQTSEGDCNNTLRTAGSTGLHSIKKRTSRAPFPLQGT